VFGTYSDSEFGIIAKEKDIFRKAFFKPICIAKLILKLKTHFIKMHSAY
jgi:hypothetical protein